MEQELYLTIQYAGPCNGSIHQNGEFIGVIMEIKSKVDLREASETTVWN